MTLAGLWQGVIVAVRYFYNGDKRCTIAVESTSARRRELYAELRHHERAHPVNLHVGLDPVRFTCAESSTSSGWIGPGVVARGFTRRVAVTRGVGFRSCRHESAGCRQRRRECAGCFELSSLAEAAQMQSWHLTEPMRCSSLSPTTCAALDAAENRGGGNVTETPRCATFLSPESRWRRRGLKGRIELAGLLGLHLARRGFWGAIFSKSPRRRNVTWRIAQGCQAPLLPRERRKPSLPGNRQRPDPV
jgi:hypothetical protein